MNLLTAVNGILPKVGEHPVTTLNMNHPTLAIILPEMEAQRKSLLLPGWWFNTFTRTLLPDVSGIIAVPDDTLSFVPAYSDAIQRGARLIKLDETEVFTEGVKGNAIVDVDFEELPQAAAEYVLYTSLVVVYATDIGVERELQVWQTLADRAEARLTSEHLRNMRHSTRRSRQYLNYRKALRM